MLGLPFTPGAVQSGNESGKSKAPAEVVRMSRERGVLLLTAGSDAVRLVPSLTVKKDEVDFAVDVIESVLGDMQKR